MRLGKEQGAGYVGDTEDAPLTELIFSDSERASVTADQEPAVSAGRQGACDTSGA